MLSLLSFLRFCGGLVLCTFSKWNNNRRKGKIVARGWKKGRRIMHCTCFIVAVVAIIWTYKSWEFEKFSIQFPRYANVVIGHRRSVVSFQIIHKCNHTHEERDAQNIHRNGHTYVFRQRYNRPKSPTFRLSRAKQRVINQRTTHEINSQTTNLIDHRSRLACFGFYCYVEKSYWFLAPIIQSVAFVLLPCISHPLFNSLALWHFGNGMHLNAQKRAPIFPIRNPRVLLLFHT